MLWRREEKCFALVAESTAEASPMARAPFHRAVPGKTRRTGHCSLERCPVYRALPFKARTVNKGGPLVSPIGLHIYTYCFLGFEILPLFLKKKFRVFKS